MKELEYQSCTLSNGLKIVHKYITGNVSYSGFFVNVGTRDENSDEFGMAHFIEHMLFKGTKKRRSHHIINRMEAVGGELNAYTNKEETVIYSIFLEPHFERAFDLLTDLVFNSEFPQYEIDKEVDVIIDEINSYEDSPSELIFDEFENLVFNDSQLGHNILGDVRSLESFTTQKAKDFINKHYSLDNMVFFSLGSTSFKKVVRIAEKYAAGIQSEVSLKNRILPDLVAPTKLIENKDTTQAHVLLGNRAYSMSDDRRRGLFLLNNILGGPGMNSRLNISLREKRGYVYNVESSFTPYTDVGIFSIYFGTDKENAEKCMKLVDIELQKLRNVRLSETKLAAAKKQLIGQICVSTDNHENMALSLGKNYFHHGHCDSVDEFIVKINGITSDELLEISNEILDMRNMFKLVYV